MCVFTDEGEEQRSGLFRVFLFGKVPGLKDLSPERIGAGENHLFHLNPGIFLAFELADAFLPECGLFGLPEQSVGALQEECGGAAEVGAVFERCEPLQGLGKASILQGEFGESFAGDATFGIELHSGFPESLGLRLSTTAGECFAEKCGCVCGWLQACTFFERTDSVFAASQLQQGLAVFQKEFCGGNLQTCSIRLNAEELIPGFDTLLIVCAVTFEHADEGLSTRFAGWLSGEEARGIDSFVVTPQLGAAG
jgi:hypothetical protein